MAKQKPGQTVDGRPVPRCPKCARAGTASGAQQFRKIGGIRRLHAHLTDKAGHEWWDRSPEARKMAKVADATRVAEGKKNDLDHHAPPAVR